MAANLLTLTMRRLRRLSDAQFVGALSDAELMTRVVETRDEAAFETLMWRHGPMVLTVCRRVLHHDQDAEDAFQATFLVLYRKANTLSKHESVGAWLHRVAFRVALRAARKSDRRQETALITEPGAAKQREPDERKELIDCEINRLPEPWRRVVVLCLLEGKSYAEAAKEIGCPLGTVQSRLGRARQRLQTRLAKQGVTATGGFAGLLALDNVAGAAPTAILVHATLDAIAGGFVSAPVAALTLEMLRALWLTRAGNWSAAILATFVLLSVVGWMFASTIVPKVPQPIAAPIQQPGIDEAARRIKLEEELKRIEGEWQLVAGFEDGEPMTAASIKATVMTFLPGNRVNLGCRRPDDRFTLVPDGPLPGICMEVTHASGATTKSVGVYELTAKSLRICLGSEERPAHDFAISKGAGHRYWELQRPGAADEIK